MKNIKKEQVIKFGQEFMEKFKTFDPMGIAAQSAYYFLFSIFPLLLFLVTLLPYLHLDVSLITDKLASSMLPPELLKVINQMLDSVLNQKDSSLSIIAFLLSIFSSSSAMNSIVKSINRIYEDEFSRNGIIFRIISILITLGCITMIFVSYLVISIGDNVLTFLHLEQFMFIVTLVKYVLLPVLIFGFMYALYHFSPSVKLKTVEILPGTILSSSLLIVFTLVFTNYINLFAQSFTKYGIFSSLMLLMLWFYSIGLIIMLGAILNSTIQDTKIKIEK